MSTLKVFMPGKGEVRLQPSDHLASGGEGAVYLKNGTVFKIFLHPDRARANGMREKIALLSKLKHPFIVAPTDILLDAAHELIGYTMPEAAGIPLVKTFTNAWRDQNSFADKEATQLVNHMRTAVQAAHDLSAVIADGNEMNYLVQGVEPRLIDVDSWQIGPHPATALMPSIQDFHRQGFDALSDWFSWGIVTFQVFTGIHPYKGTHPGFKKGDLEARMRANASVFDSQVKLNAAVRDFNRIPSPLLDWYEGVFAKGERAAPPDFLHSAAPKALTKRLRTVQQGTGIVRHERLRSLPGPVRHVSANGVAFYAAATGLAAFDLVRNQALPSLTSAQIAALFENQAGLIRFGNGFVYLSNNAGAISGQLVVGERDPVPLQLSTNALPCLAEKLAVISNKVYALNSRAVNGMVELALSAVGSRIVLTTKAAWPVNVKATRFYDGFALMDCLGAPFVVMPEGDSVHILRAPALADYRVVNGFGRSLHRLWVHALRRSDGQLFRIELRANGREFEVLHAALVDVAEMNVAVSPKGIGVAIFEDGVVSVSNTQGDSVQEVKDASVSPEMHLYGLPDGVFYFQGSDLFRLSFGK